MSENWTHHLHVLLYARFLYANRIHAINNMSKKNVDIYGKDTEKNCH